MPPGDVEWHYVGHLQSNKVKTLLSMTSALFWSEFCLILLFIVNHLDRAVSSLGRNPLKVLVQVNASGEASKSGVGLVNCVELAKYVKLNCPNFAFSGLMTIGMPYYTSTPTNFKVLPFSYLLYNCRTDACKALGIAKEQCELSMVMSGDFEQAIEMGRFHHFRAKDISKEAIRLDSPGSSGAEF
ncbi:hypothetical protein MLD38_034241 [Melastoma candidum]|uniref:Uncharacterized protein n=1 Tax=Melastoma candidum TaxID=119954 RepID=A0ACB9MDK1_9MYRT|nr:hypothetical protein MLD38_034241 [Melastoma candidum]